MIARPPAYAFAGGWRLEELSKILMGPMTAAPLLLCALGRLLKQTPHVKSWVIPWVLTAAGVMLGLAVTWKGGPVGPWLMEGALQGVVAAAMSQWYYQMWKQAAVDRKK
jgi:hypothetical protein